MERRKLSGEMVRNQQRRPGGVVPGEGKRPGEPGAPRSGKEGGR